MREHSIIATTAFGIESVVAGELKRLGYDGLTVENGRVAFKGNDRDIIRCNLWLRCADRVFIEMGQFDAFDFEELYQGTRAIPWEELIPENGKMHVTGKSVRSTLHSVPDCQSIVKRAVIDAMKRKYRREIFSESGPVYRIEVAILKDRVTLSIDTSGAGLHKRGYRPGGGYAPLRETLAAAIIYLSRWTPDRILADPMCGSGTIPIEAALMARNVAPGLNRDFVSESWPTLSRASWAETRTEAFDTISQDKHSILASDMDPKIFKVARENAKRAGVLDSITFQKKPVSEFSSRKKYGCIITNPPYGERLSNIKEVEKLYREMGRVFEKLETWSLFILSAHENLPEYFGRKDDRNRKLYNGKIKCYLYQYLGPLPGQAR
jgi:putative N6-adenine-specific DNA methylase